MRRERTVTAGWVVVRGLGVRRAVSCPPLVRGWVGMVFISEDTKEKTEDVNKESVVLGPSLYRL